MTLFFALCDIQITFITFHSSLFTFQVILRQYLSYKNYGNRICYVIKKIKRADIERIFDEFTKTIAFQYITKDSLNGRLNHLLQSNKLINKINSSKDSFFLNEDTIDMSIIDMIPYIQNSPPSKILDTSENILNSCDNAKFICANELNRNT